MKNVHLFKLIPKYAKCTERTIKTQVKSQIINPPSIKPVIPIPPTLPLILSNILSPPPLPISSVPIADQIMKFNWPVALDKPTLFWKARSTLTIWMVGLWGKFVLNVINKTEILNKDRMCNAILNRPEGVPLLTVSNHESCIDDPTLIAVFMTSRQLADQKNMRWSLAAFDVCFRTRLTGAVFTLGKCVPTIRGGGVYQKAVDFGIQKLNEGDWVHVFPEGRVNVERLDIYRFKWGIGRLLSECKRTPIIVPFWHVGMSNVLPNHSPYIPRWGKQVFVNVGEPIDISEVMQRVKGKSSIERRKEITDFIQRKLTLLREETLSIVAEKTSNKSLK